MTRPTLAPLALAAALTAAAPLAAAEIRVLNWSGYGTDEAWAIEKFAAAAGHTVVHDYFNSEQEMLTKLRTNPGAYDVVLINSAFTRAARDEGLLQPVDPSALKNFADLAPAMTGNAELIEDGKVWGVPWVWGVTGFAYDTADVTPAPTSLSVFWDPAMKGRVGWRDDALEAVQFAALATGQSINDIKDMAAVEAKLAALMPQIRTFWSSENDWNQFMAAGEFDVATYWSGSAARSKTAFGLPIEFVIPQEGVIGWLDGLSIPAGAPNVAAATQFIDWMIDPAFYVEWETKVGAPASANAKAAAALPEGAFNRTVLGDPENIARVQIMAPVADADREAYLALWQRLKAN
jgi:spermidine/putrescine transport system substrate-binding protein